MYFNTFFAVAVIVIFTKSDDCCIISIVENELIFVLWFSRICVEFSRGLKDLFYFAYKKETAGLNSPALFKTSKEVERAC